MYPLLSRMLAEGWLEDGWENAAESKGKRPPRRYYTVTDEGRIELGALLQQAKADKRFAPLMPARIGVAGVFA
jgi:PadR family transcriptional regulator PadR